MHSLWLTQFTRPGECVCEYMCVQDGEGNKFMALLAGERYYLERSRLTASSTLGGQPRFNSENTHSFFFVFRRFSVDSCSPLVHQSAFFLYCLIFLFDLYCVIYEAVKKGQQHLVWHLMAVESVMRTSGRRFPHCARRGAAGVAAPKVARWPFRCGRHDRDKCLYATRLNRRALAYWRRIDRKEVARETCRSVWPARKKLLHHKKPIRHSAAANQRAPNDRAL